MRDYEKIIADARRGLHLLKASRPGSGPMGERGAKRKEGGKLMLAFVRMPSAAWPARYRGTVDEINREIGST